MPIKKLPQISDHFLIEESNQSTRNTRTKGKILRKHKGDEFLLDRNQKSEITPTVFYHSFTRVSSLPRVP